MKNAGPIAIKCATCKAEPNTPCVSEAGTALDIVHVIRAIDAERITREDRAPKRS